MKLLDVIHSPWAIEPSKLLEIQSIYATHLRGEKIDIAAVEQRIGKPLANEPKAYEVIDGVAVIAIDGVMAKKANMLMQISGGASMQLAERDLRNAAQDPVVHSIILAIDSPGGTVDGTQTLASAVQEVAATKPVVALASGTMASAAYWVGSAAQAVYITDATTQVGSIGVVSTHQDISKRQEADGIKTTEVFAGKYKRIASQYQPLSDEGKATMQDQVDYLYSLFVQAVANHRGVSTEKVLSDMADGRVFTGQQAIDAGLVDGVSTLANLVKQLNDARNSGQAVGRAGVAPKPAYPTKGQKMSITVEQLQVQAPELLQSIKAEAATAERERIQAVQGQCMPGHEALINALAFDGQSTAGDAALAVLAAEKTSRTKHAANLASDAPAPLPIEPDATVTPNGNKALSKAEIDTQAKAYVKANPGVSYVDAVKHVQSQQA